MADDVEEEDPANVREASERVLDRWRWMSDEEAERRAARINEARRRLGIDATGEGDAT